MIYCRPRTDVRPSSPTPDLYNAEHTTIPEANTETLLQYMVPLLYEGKILGYPAKRTRPFPADGH